jgi:hypothetical protein
MNTGSVALVIVISIVFLFVLRWCHRCWGKAILSALFAPLVGAPIAAVAFLAIALILRTINGFLSSFGASISNTSLTMIASIATALVVLFLVVLYCREQRSLSLVQYGPRFGPRYHAPSPKINQKGPLH